ncbi:ribonuclease H [Sesbania bispinosa]|nr:ribonuclease H [Sesbania bispinosa]
MSNAWRGITATWGEFAQGLKWNVERGTRIPFWHDRELPSNTIIGDIVLGDIPLNITHHSLTQFSNDGRAWILNDIAHLPNHVRNEIESLLPPGPLLDPHTVGWRLTSNGVFSTRSTYCLIEDFQENVSESRIWKNFLSLKIPTRLRASFC